MSVEVCKNRNKNDRGGDSMNIVCVKQLDVTIEASCKRQKVSLIESKLSFSMVNKAPIPQLVVPRKDSVVSGEMSPEVSTMFSPSNHIC